MKPTAFFVPAMHRFTFLTTRDAMLYTFAMTQRYKIFSGTITEIETAVNALAELNNNWILVGGAMPDKKAGKYIQTMARIDQSSLRYKRRLASLRGSRLD